MTTAAILKTIQALPSEEQMKIVEQVIHSLRVGKPKRIQKPESPSPSGDPWYDDPRNVAIVKEAVKSMNEEKGIVLKSKEDIKEYFANR